LSVNPNAYVIYSNAPDVGLQNHITNAVSVAGYASWGYHSTNLGSGYATNGSVVFRGNSGWYLIQTFESQNGQRYDPNEGTFIKWFSSNAFGSTGYSNTPVGAVSHTDEPYLVYVNNPTYFGFWEMGKNFAQCAWASRATTNFQAVGDPFVTK